MNDKQTIEAILVWSRQNRDKYRLKYDETGAPSTLQTCERYEDIEDICMLAMDAREEADTEKLMRLRNIDTEILAIKAKETNHIKTMYTADEVINIVKLLTKYY